MQKEEFLRGYRTFMTWVVGVVVFTTFITILIFVRKDANVKDLLDSWSWFYIVVSTVVLLKNGAQSVIDNGAKRITFGASENQHKKEGEQ